MRGSIFYRFETILGTISRIINARRPNPPASAVELPGTTLTRSRMSRAGLSLLVKTPRSDDVEKYFTSRKTRTCTKQGHIREKEKKSSSCSVNWPCACARLSPEGGSGRRACRSAFRAREMCPGRDRPAQRPLSRTFPCSSGRRPDGVKKLREKNVGGVTFIEMQQGRALELGRVRSSGLPRAAGTKHAGTKQHMISVPVVHRSRTSHARRGLVSGKVTLHSSRDTPKCTTQVLVLF